MKVTRGGEGEEGRAKRGRGNLTMGREIQGEGGGGAAIQAEYTGAGA